MRKTNLVLSMILIFAVLLAACAPKATPAPAEPQATEAAAQPAENAYMDELIKAAQAEGMLTTIALPARLVQLRRGDRNLQGKYGIEVNELNPDGSSADEIEAIKANKGNKGPQAPDVIDVGLAFGPQLVAEGLAMPYKVQTWDTIPDALKDPDGNYWGDQYGVMAFEVNKDAVENVPQDFSDLLKPEYKGKVALSGDPRASAQAQNAILAAALGKWRLAG